MDTSNANPIQGGIFAHPPGPFYSRPFGFMQNPDVAKEIASLDPERDCQRIAYLMVSYEYSTEIVSALNMAYFGSGATKAIADILGRTDFSQNAMKRYDDTRFLIWKFMESGWDTDQGHRAIMHMNKIHGQFKIPNERFGLAICAFINAPLVWIDNFGWRKITQTERMGWFNFWIGVGGLMGIEQMPQSPEESLQWTQDYFSGHEEVSEYSPAIGESQFGVFVKRAAWYKRPFMRWYLHALMTPALERAYGLKKMPIVMKLPAAILLKLSALRRKVFARGMYPYFIDRETSFETYPNGTPVVEEAGPTRVLEKLKAKQAEM